MGSKDESIEFKSKLENRVLDILIIVDLEA
jgi:hypothetical protein